MSEKGIWWGGLAALAVLAFFCIRHHLGDAELQPVEVQGAAAPAAPAVALPSRPATTAPAAAETAQSPAAAEATAQAIAGELRSRGVEFASNSAVLTLQGQATLDAILPFLQNDTVSRFEIAGHTDSLGDARANQALAEARARTVAAYLTMKGISPDRFVAKGYAANQPAGSNATADGRQRNRRIEFRPL
jgi:outer membrane protein OmpA-like peptidoglycan-associated protein